MPRPFMVAAMHVRAEKLCSSIHNTAARSATLTWSSCFILLAVRLRCAVPDPTAPTQQPPSHAQPAVGLVGHSVSLPVPCRRERQGDLACLSNCLSREPWNPPESPHHHLPNGPLPVLCNPKASGSPPPDRQPSPAPPVNCPPCSPAASCLTVQPVRTRACPKTRHRRAMHAASAAAGGNSVRLSRISLQPPFQDGDGGAAQPMQMARRLPPLGPSRSTVSDCPGPRAVPCRGACLTAGMRLEV